MLAVVAAGWMDAHEVAASMSITVARVRQIAQDLKYAQTIQLRRILKNDRWVIEYRLKPPGHVEPLYESRMDAWPLAQVWSGYTYKGAQQCRV